MVSRTLQGAVPDSIYEQVEYIVATKKFMNKSDLVRQAVRKFVEDFFEDYEKTIFPVFRKEHD